MVGGVLHCEVCLPAWLSHSQSGNYKAEDSKNFMDLFNDPTGPLLRRWPDEAAVNVSVRERERKWEWGGEELGSHVLYTALQSSNTQTQPDVLFVRHILFTSCFVRLCYTSGVNNVRLHDWSWLFIGVCCLAWIKLYKMTSSANISHDAKRLHDIIKLGVLLLVGLRDRLWPKLHIIRSMGK